MLMNMAVDLGLNSNSSAISVTAEDLKKKATWNAVLRLHNFVSLCGSAAPIVVTDLCTVFG